MPASSSGTVWKSIQKLMLDWFSRSRITDEQEQEVAPKQPGAVLPEYVFRKPDGGLTFLASLDVLVLLGGPLDAGLAYFLERLRRKFAGVRRKQTRVLVVTRPEHLSTVVALGGDLAIVADESGDAMLDMGAGKRTIIYYLGPDRAVRDMRETIDFNDPLPFTRLRPAA
jgi:hypothetical protein